MAWQFGEQPLSPATQRRTNRKTVFQEGLGIKKDPKSKIANTKRARSMAQVGEHLCSKLEALSSNHNSVNNTEGR
jgi:hypothetical protein